MTVRMGWLSDDAFISFRAAVNLVEGHGLVSNIGERVQGFTSPLWTLAVAAFYWAIRDVYVAPMLLSVLAATGTGWLLARRRDAGWAAALALFLPTASHGFVSYSTSGLENPLAHLLLAWFVVARLRPTPSPRAVWWVAGLLVLNRLDHVLLIAPVLIHELVGAIRRREHWRTMASAAIGLSPLLAWLLFATIYYGSPLPNTAYAKLNVEAPRLLLLGQGVSYVVDAALRDPIVPLALAFAGAAVWMDRKRGLAPILLYAGTASYVLYVVWVGGDFMSGRFFTAPYLVSVVLLADAANRAGVVVPALVAAAAACLGLRTFEPMQKDVRTRCDVGGTGIVDERGCYVEHTGIAENLRIKKYLTHPYNAVGKRFALQPGPVVTTTIGIAAFAAGPQVHLIDAYGLTDPLLARIRYQADDQFRIGHFARPIPPGYIDSLRSGQNQIADPCAHRLWDDLRLLTRGPLLAPGRFGAILRMNLGQGTCPPAEG